MKRYLRPTMDILKTTALIDLLIALVFYLFARIYSGYTNISEIGLAFSQYLLLLLFSFILAVFGLIFRIRQLPSIWKYVLHYSVLLATFAVLFSVTGKFNFTPTTVTVLIIVYTLIYVIVALLIHFISSKTKENNPAEDKGDKNEPPKYQKMF